MGNRNPRGMSGYFSFGNFRRGNHNVASVQRTDVTPPVVRNETELILRHWQDAVPDDRLAHLIRDVARALERRLQSRLAAHDIPFGHWTFLRVLWNGDGLTQRELSREAGVKEATTTAVVRQMEQDGHVVRRHVGGNRRRQYVFLTTSGKALEQHLIPLAIDVNKIAIGAIDEIKVTSMRETLLTMIENLAASENSGDNV